MAGALGKAGTSCLSAKDCSTARLSLYSLSIEVDQHRLAVSTVFGTSLKLLPSATEATPLTSGEASRKWSRRTAVVKSVRLSGENVRTDERRRDIVL